MDELRKFFVPELVTGTGALALAGRYAVNLGCRRLLVVTDPGVREAGWSAQGVASLQQAGLTAAVFDEVSPNPRVGEVVRGTERFQAEGCDAILAVGGGSPLDCAKGIAILAANGGVPGDFEGGDEVREPGPPLICVPTTAGTGADVSQFAILMDPVERRKFAIISRRIVPDAALIDYSTLHTAPSFLRACTGMDALTHAVEALASNASAPLTDLLALEAVRLVRAHLREIVAGPGRPEQLRGMMRASLLAGMAFSNASLGAVHAMAHALGGYLDLPHGLCNALLLPHVVAYNYETAPEAYGALGEALGLGRERHSLVAGLLAMNRDLGIAQTLGSLGVQVADLPILEAMALRDPCMVTNPRRPVPGDLRTLYADAL